MKFSKTENKQYLRHFLLPEIGEKGQQKLKNSSILCVGAGGLGSPNLLYLAAAGIGKIGIIDNDIVDISNLQRQIIFTTKDIGKQKANIAKKKLTEINPHIEATAINKKFTPENAKKIISKYDILLDCSDNFPTRYLCNDICVLEKKINIQAAVYKFDGTITAFAPHLGSPCYRCIFPELPPPDSIPNCAESGVLGVLPGIMGTLQAVEAIKIILNQGDPLYGKLLTYDALNTRFYKMSIEPDKDCKICSQKNQNMNLPNDYNVKYCENIPNNNEENNHINQLSVELLNERLNNNTTKNIKLIDVREKFEFEITSIKKAINLPLSEIPYLDKNKINNMFKKNDELYFICAAGIRSQKAASIFLSHGFTNITNIIGGMHAWEEQI